MTDGRRFTMEDIIKSEVEKALTGRGLIGPAAKAASGSGFEFKDIMTFLSEVNKLAALREKTMAPVRQDQRAVAETAKAPTGSALNKDITPVTDNAPVLGPTPITAESVYASITGGLDGVITLYGDIPLSEAKKKMAENKDAILALLRQQMGLP
jgi:hypothetical protein